MKNYSIISSICFVFLTILFYKIPRTEIETQFISQEQLGTNTVLSDWKIKTTYGYLISPSSVNNFSNKTLYLGKEILGNDMVYIRLDALDKEEKIFIKGIHSNDYSFILISLLMGLQFFILIGMSEKKEGLFLNAFCIFLMVMQFLYMLRLVII